MNHRRQAAFWAGCGGVVVLALLSLALGSRAVPFASVWAALQNPDPANDLHLVVIELRLPRTILAITAGAALGLAGAVMQAVTRNPLAEPGLLGVNAGAALAVVVGAMVFGLTDIMQYVWFGLLGAGLAGAGVFILGRAHESGTDPVRLVLAGAGLTVVLGAGAGILVQNAPPQILDVFLNWGSGSLEGRPRTVGIVMTVALIIGGGLSLFIAAGLNALALGQEAGRALGVRPGVIWSLACLSVMVLAGTATAAAGPIGFIGLVAPHFARAICGPDNRQVLPLSAIFAAGMLLIADIAGRLIAAPEEVAAGIVATILGGPFFILIVRRFRIAQP